MEAEVMTAPAPGVSRTPCAVWTGVDPDLPDYGRTRVMYRVIDADGAVRYEIDD